MLIKLGEATVIASSDIKSADVIANQEILDRFKKFAQELKIIAPKAKDFLYFTAVMMHAAEAALIDDNGEIKKDANGNPISAQWELVGDGVKWICSDPNIKPLSNSNRDIFPESELLKAHAKWRGRPLCLDHQSSSVDMVRGLVIDTIYDKKHKRVIALCALDKKNYPDLARKVSTGYAASVSMGTAVGRAVCTDCHRVARVESDFCEHMQNKSCYGEVNLDLAPIELSIVVNGADPNAKIKHIIAKDLSRAAEHIGDYVKQKVSEGNVSKDELAALQKDLSAITNRVRKLVEASQEQEEDNNDTAYGTTGSKKTMEESEIGTNWYPNPPTHLVNYNSQMTYLREKLSNIEEDLKKLTAKEEPAMAEKTAYYQGTEDPTPGRPQYEKENYETIRDTQDKQMVGQPPFPDTGPVDGMHPGVQSAGESEEARKRRLQRLAEARERQMRREAALAKARSEIEKAKRAYHQGTEEPTPGKPQYEKEDYESIRDKKDKQMVGRKPFPDVGPVDGLYGDDKKRKEMLSRAKLRAKFLNAAKPDGQLDKKNSCWQVFADNKLILNATVDEISRGNSEVMFESVATKDFGRNIMDRIKSEGFNKVRSLYKGGQLDLSGLGVDRPEGGPMMDLPTALPEEMGTVPMESDVNRLMQWRMNEGRSAGEYPEWWNMLHGDWKVDDRGALYREATSRHYVKKEAVPAQAQGAPGVPADAMPAAPPAPAGPVAEPPTAELPAEPMDLEEPMTGGSDEDSFNAIAQEIRDMADELAKRADDLVDAVNKMEGETLEDVPPAAEEEFIEGKVASIQDLQKMRKTVHGMLKNAMKECVQSLRDHGKELKMAENIYKDKTTVRRFNTEQSQYLHSLSAEALMEANSSLKDARELMGAFVKYAQGTVAVVKRARLEAKLKKKAQAQNLPLPPVKPEDLLRPDEDEGDEGAGKQKPPVPPLPPGQRPVPPQPLPEEPLMADDEMFAEDVLDAPMPAEYDPQTGELTMDVKAEKFDLTTKKGRAMYRAKLAQKAVQYSDMLQKAHPGGGHSLEGLDVTPSDEGHKFETLEEAKSKHMAVVTKEVKKQARRIAQLISEGRLDPSQVDELIAQGVDAEAVAYYKKYWAEAKDSESKQWASDLVKEHTKQKQAEKLKKEEIRIKRAYDLAYEMRDKGIIETSQIKDQVATILKWNDAAYDSSKRMVAKMASLRKNAMPEVGMLSSEDVVLPMAERAEFENVNLQDVFDKYFADKRL